MIGACRSVSGPAADWRDGALWVSNGDESFAQLAGSAAGRGYACILYDPSCILYGLCVLHFSFLFFFLGPSLVTRHAPGWADSLPGVRHYLYPVHRSGAFLTPPSLAARLSLLLCRWLARDFESVFELSTCTAVDTKLSAEEAQLWALLADFEDDVEPGAHACRLRLWLATRCCGYASMCSTGKPEAACLQGSSL